MKNNLVLITGLSLMILSSCGGEKSPEATAAKDSSATSGATLLADDAPAYNATAIDPAAKITEVSIEATGANMAEMKYDKSTIEVPAGTTIKLTFKSSATDPSMPHNWVLIRKGNLDRIVKKGMEAGADKGFVPVDEDLLIASKLLGPGEKTELTFPAPPAGEYQFVCTYPGHSAKMQGVFIVK